MRPWVSILVFSASVFAAPLEKRDPASLFLGYRVVNKAEADLIYQNDQKLIPSNGSGGRQLGGGTYIAPNFKQWEPTVDDYWDCAITVDPDDWAKVNLAWLPKTISQDDKCIPLWFPRNVANRVKYLQSFDPTWNTDNTALIADIVGFEGQTQMLIPTPFIKDLAFHAQCVDRANKDLNAKVGNYGNADWSFGGRVKGLPS